MAPTWFELEHRWGPSLPRYLESLANAEIHAYFTRLRERDRRIVGFGFGPKQTNGEDVNDAAVIFFVEEKLRRERLTPSYEIPREIAGLPTDVIAIGSLRTLAYRYDRPVPWGCGVELPDYDFDQAGVAYQSEVGTLGGVVVDKNQHAYVLGNAHVLAPGATASASAATAGVHVLQGQSNVRSDAIAKLSRWVPVKALGNPANSAYWNYVDAAIAEILSPSQPNAPSFVEGDAAPGTSVTQWFAIEDISAHMPLRYYGFGQTRQSDDRPGSRNGKVIAIGARVVFPYEGRDSLFVDQIIMDGEPQRGDSGSLAFSPKRFGDWSQSALVGLVCAGSTGDKVTPALPPKVKKTKITVLSAIERVFALLRVERGTRWRPPRLLLPFSPHALPQPPSPRRIPIPRPPPEPPFPSLASYLSWKGIHDVMIEDQGEGAARELRVLNAPAGFKLPPSFAGVPVRRAP